MEANGHTSQGKKSAVVQANGSRSEREKSSTTGANASRSEGQKQTATDANDNRSEGKKRTAMEANDSANEGKTRPATDANGNRNEGEKRTATDGNDSISESKKRTTIDANDRREDKKIVFFFDIDNCLYPKSYQIHDKMSVLIDDYFQRHLELSKEDAYHLHQRYYRDYGLAIEGLVRHHKVDPLEYNLKVDDALPLDEIIKPNAELRKMLQDIDTTRVRLWLFTNANVTHGTRVVKLLEVDDLFEGITYCDYAATPLLCKPSPDMFAKAMREAGIDDPNSCYFVDDSGLNIQGAKKLGWKTAHLVEASAKPPPEPTGDHQISHLEELRTVFPEVFNQ